MKRRVYPCPACGFEVHDEPPGSFSICFCGWEDDNVQLEYIHMRGGANNKSLVEAQMAAVAKYPLSMKSFNEFNRAPNWRPIREGDVYGYTYKPGSDEFIAYYWEL